MTAIKVTGLRIIQTRDALGALSAVDDKKKPIYSFTPKAKILLAKKLKQLGELVDDLDAHRKALTHEMGLTGAEDSDGKSIEDPAKVAEWKRRWSEYLAVEQDVEIGLIDEALLNMGTEEAPKNDIPFAFLTDLDWLINWAK